MRPAEIIFRVAAGVGGWIILLAYGVTLAALPAADCVPGDAALWRGTLAFGIVAGLAALLCGAGDPWHGSLRWLALLAAPLLAYDAWWIAGAVHGTTLLKASLCATSDLPATAVERAWPPVQLGVLAAALFRGVRLWRR